MTNSPSASTGHVLGRDPRGVEFFRVNQQSRLLYQASLTDLEGEAYWLYTHHVKGFEAEGLIVLLYGEAARLYERTDWRDKPAFFLQLTGISEPRSVSAQTVGKPTGWEPPPEMPTLERVILSTENLSAPPVQSLSDIKLPEKPRVRKEEWQDPWNTGG